MEIDAASKEKKIKHYAIDLDGCLAYHQSSWKASKIGEPLMPMVNKVKQFLADGQKVSIFTARMSHPECDHPKQISMIKEFLAKAGLPTNLDITCIKWYYFDEFYDDKAFRVKRNKGTLE